MNLWKTFPISFAQAWNIDLHEVRLRSRSKSLVLGSLLLSVFGQSFSAPLFAIEKPAGSSEAAESSEADSEEIFFESHVRPILREHCLDCHGAAEEAEGNLDLRLVRLIKQGGDSGPAIDLDSPELSELLTQVDSDSMPPGEGKVPAGQKAILRKWIETGARNLRAEPESIGFGIPLTEEERAYWAYRPISKPNPTTPVDGVAIRTGLDAVLSDAMPSGLSFSSDADRETLIRRLYVDLTGIYPTLADFQRWQNEQSSEWYEKLIDELLASPEYGERWGRHWLDAVGYSDSDGATINDSERPWAWQYRDYVIKSMNQDKPFDQFIQEQLAGDEIAGPANGDWTSEQIECLTATGFLRMAADGTGSGDNSPEARNKTVADTLQIIGGTLLSSSMNCAQCHDHRYDPISHQDYTALRAIFEPSLDWQNWQTPQQRLVSLYTQSNRDEAAEVEKEAQKLVEEKSQKQKAYIQEVLEAELAKRPEELREPLRLAHQTPGDKRTDEQKLLLEQNPSANVTAGSLYLYRPDAAEELKKFDERIAEVRAKKPAEAFLHALVEPANHSPVTKLFHRGDHNSPTRDVAPGKLSVLTPEGEPTEFLSDDPSVPTTGRRLAFSKWLTDTEKPNPLLLRSLINRIWLQHFGKGIVATPGDFGLLGATPTNPEVLDWLATYWLEQKWSLKKLHKVILMSTVYRQSSLRNENGVAIDPENNLYWRKPIQRLEAEVIRDSILRISSSLDSKQFGPPLALQEDETGQVRIDPNQTRRSVYAKARRSQPVALLQSFDAPVMTINCDIRERSTVPMQSLMLMNGEFAIAQSEKTARNIIASISATQTKPESVTNRQVSSTTDSVGEATTQSDSAVWKLPAAPKASWEYGVGKLNLDQGVLENFEHLTHFTGATWQEAKEFPSQRLGFASLSASSGHPGNPDVAVVRRWTAPFSGTLKVNGKLNHPSPNGDGVRAVVISKQGAVKVWNAKQGETPTELSELSVEKGEVVDFVIDCIESETSDSFQWDLSLELHPSNAEGNSENGLNAKREFNFATEFRGPTDDYALLEMCVRKAWADTLLREPTDQELAMLEKFAVAQLELLHAEPHRVQGNSTAMTLVLSNICQMLTSSNEFLYID